MGTRRTAAKRCVEVEVEPKVEPETVRRHFQNVDFVVAVELDLARIREREVVFVQKVVRHDQPSIASPSA